MSAPELNAVQSRVLGALIEKAMTTPQAYPLTENAVITACNQTTNRDPVVTYDQTTVRRALLDLRQEGLSRLVHRISDRNEKHAHKLDERLDLGDGALAVMAVLMLRGPQTAAELRVRTERMHAFASPEEVAASLEHLAQRDEPLVEALPKQPGRKGVRYRHLLAEVLPGEEYRDPHAVAQGSQEPGSQESGSQESEWREIPTPAAMSDDDVRALAAEVGELRREVAELRDRLDDLTG